MLINTHPYTQISQARICTSVLLSCSHLAEDGYSVSRVKKLLSPEKTVSLIVLPTGCLEQTMVKLAPTASAIRYLDQSEQWFHLPPGARDDALDKLEQGRTAGPLASCPENLVHVTDIRFKLKNKLNLLVSSPPFVHIERVWVCVCVYICIHIKWNQCKTKKKKQKQQQAALKWCH